VFSALTAIVIARQLGPGAFGQYAASLSLTRLASVLFSLGLNGWLLRNGGRDKERLGSISTACLSLKAGLGVIWLLGIVLVSPRLDQDAFPASLVCLSALSLWLEELANTVWTIFKSVLRNNVTLGLMVGSQALLFLLTLALATTGMKEAHGYLVGRVAASAVSSAVALIIVARVFGMRLEFTDVRCALKETLPFGASIALATIYGQADVTIVAHWLGKTAAGLYSPAISLMTAFFLTPAAIYGVMLPLLSQSHLESPELVRRTSTRLVAWTTALGGALGGGMILIAHPLVLFVYGSEFAVSGDVLAVLSGVLALKCLSFSLAAIVVAVGWQNRRVIVQALSATLNIALNVLIVQTLGIMGVAKVYVLSEAVLVFGYMMLVVWWRRRSKFGIEEHRGR
jgi:O-antigen/teichoic acid export membrane protein